MVLETMSQSPNPQISWISYSNTFFEEKALKEMGFSFKEEAAVSWLHVQGAHDVEILAQMGALFEVHPLMSEEILNVRGRPRIEIFGENMLIILKHISFDENKMELIKEQLSVVWGPGFILSLQEGTSPIFQPVIENLHREKSKLRTMGDDYLFHAMLDTIVDHYYEVLNQMEQLIENLESDVLKNPTSERLETVYRLKRETTSISVSLLPMREVARNLQKGQHDVIQQENLIYFRDVYHDLAQAVDTVIQLQEMLSSVRNAFHSAVSHRMNRVMKVLTIISTVFMPPTLITSIYGMNFTHIPELQAHWGYPIVLMFILLIVISMMFYFRKKKII
ncbi:magnesium/cobalt transporter CorA [Deltaproteobacteria bacterium TL4]